MESEDSMYLTFRWYADKDSIPLSSIRQIPAMRGVVSALYDEPPGSAWTAGDLRALRQTIEAAGLEFRVVESIPVPEGVKLGGPDRNKGIDSWLKSLKAVAEALGPGSEPTGSEEPVVVTYNFMPVFDWTRSELSRTLPDGSTALAYDSGSVERMDPLDGDLELPGWMARYSKEEMYRLLSDYRALSDDDVYGNLTYFLRAVCPEAERLGLRLAIHPDDPPWSVFGIPRIMTGATALRKLFSDVPSPANGLCLCTGSFGVLPANDLPSMAKEFAGRTRFVHMRNVKVTGPKSFEESAHWKGAGSIDLAAVIDALQLAGFKGPVRPDHGRMIWGESGKPGYGLFDRALGASYIQGLIDAGSRSRKSSSFR